MTYLPDVPGKCEICNKEIPYATGAAYKISGKVHCRKCAKVHAEKQTGLARELSIAEISRTNYVEPYNFAS